MSTRCAIGAPSRRGKCYLEGLSQQLVVVSRPPSHREHQVAFAKARQRHVRNHEPSPTYRTGALDNLAQPSAHVDSGLDQSDLDKNASRAPRDDGVYHPIELTLGKTHVDGEPIVGRQNPTQCFYDVLLVSSGCRIAGSDSFRVVGRKDTRSSLDDGLGGPRPSLRLSLFGYLNRLFREVSKSHLGVLVPKPDGHQT